MEGTVLLTFDVGLDGRLQNVQGSLNGQVPESQLIHRLLFAAKKTLLDEEVLGITVNSDKYVLKISANGALFSGVVVSVPPA
jgi:hypothetical protein